MIRTSEAIDELSAALAEFQAVASNPAKDKDATIKSDKGSFKYTYVDFATALQELRPALGKCGLSFVQMTSIHEGRTIHLHTRVMHKSGQWIEGDYPVGPLAEHRTMGSALSYARRYSLFSAIGIQGDEDDDGAVDEKNHKEMKTGTPSKAASREPFQGLIVEMRKAQTLEALKEWVKLRRADIEKLPSDWLAEFDAAYEDHRNEVVARAA